ncbi:unnamed protein product, partial [Didymodactylos carnosus]
AIYVPTDDLTDPAPATTFAHLDATTVLTRGIAVLLFVVDNNIQNFCCENATQSTGLFSQAKLDVIDQRRWICCSPHRNQDSAGAAVALDRCFQPQLCHISTIAYKDPSNTYSTEGFVSNESRLNNEMMQKILDRILSRVMQFISLEELSTLRCCLPRILQQVFEQSSTVTPKVVIEWIVNDIVRQSFHERKHQKQY